MTYSIPGSYLYTQQSTYISPEAEKLMLGDLARNVAQGPESKQTELWKYAEAHLAQSAVTRVSSFGGILNDPAQVLLKLLTFTYDQEHLMALAHEFENHDDLTVTRSSPYNLEFSHPDAQKGAALADLAHRYGLPMARTIAIGDNFNDLSMMRVAGRAVAMGGANETIQAACQSVTLRCEEDGVAYALAELLG